MKINKLLNLRKPLIVAEIGQVHDGSLGNAHNYVDELIKIGVDAIKFQIHYANEESSPDDLFRINFSYQDKTRYDYWKRIEFTENEWAEIFNKCKKNNIIFFSSVFSYKALKILKKNNSEIYKIASGEINNDSLMNEILKTKKHIMVSTGMSDFKEIDKIYNKLKKANANFSFLHCTSKYPTPIEDIGLNIISELKEKYSIPIGFSDHSGNYLTSFAAISYGIKILELHVTFDKRLFGPDTSSSITIDELKKIIEYRDYYNKLDRQKINKNKLAKNLSKTKALFSRSATAKINLNKNTILKKEMIKYTKPGFGISEKEIKKYIGKKIFKNIKENYQFKKKDFVK